MQAQDSSERNAERTRWVVGLENDIVGQHLQHHLGRLEDASCLSAGSSSRSEGTRELVGDAWRDTWRVSLSPSTVSSTWYGCGDGAAPGSAVLDLRSPLSLALDLAGASRTGVSGVAAKGSCSVDNEAEDVLPGRCGASRRSPGAEASANADADADAETSSVSLHCARYLRRTCTAVQAPSAIMKTPTT